MVEVATEETEKEDETRTRGNERSCYARLDAIHVDQ
jgi:hypothetical protein